jgi:putative restriction endonuclease
MQRINEQIANLKCSNRGGFKAPHKAIYLLSLIDLVELGIIKNNKFHITEELINIFKINWNRYVGNSRYFNCNIWNPIYYMELDIIFKVSDIDYDNQKPQCIERCLEVYKYFEFSPILWKALQNERDRNDIKRLLIDKYIINNRCKNNSFMIELIPLLINSCYLLAI